MGAGGKDLAREKVAGCERLLEEFESDCCAGVSLFDMTSQAAGHSRVEEMGATTFTNRTYSIRRSARETR
jgi:hypothetical protein